MKKIVFVPNPTKDPELTCSRKAAALLSEIGFLVAAEPALTGGLPNVVPLEGEMLYRGAHAMVVLGGDGSILRAAERAALYDIPILAVNLGRLGYIAQLEKDDIGRLAEILSSDFKTESRSLLSVSLRRGSEYLFRNFSALNDAVIRKSGHGMVDISLACNGEMVNRYRADGLIVSTATGSTAYAMSAGGAVIDPALKIMEVTPICAHSLKARPIVFSCRAALTVTVESENAAVTLDGENTVPLAERDCVEITLSDKAARLITLSGGFCHILFRKMSDL